MQNSQFVVAFYRHHVRFVSFFKASLCFKLHFVVSFFHQFYQAKLQTTPFTHNWNFFLLLLLFACVCYFIIFFPFNSCFVMFYFASYALFSNLVCFLFVSFIFILIHFFFLFWLHTHTVHRSIRCVQTVLCYYIFFTIPILLRTFRKFVTFNCTRWMSVEQDNKIAFNLWLCLMCCV